MENSRSQEYLNDRGPLHHKLEWPRGFPELPLAEESTGLWEQLETTLGDRILTMLVQQMCERVDEMGRMDAVEKRKD